MKKVIVNILLIVLCSIPLRGQSNSSFKSLFDSYSQKKDCQTVMMGQPIFEMMEQKTRDAGKDVSGFSVLKGIDVIYIMKVPVSYKSFESELNNSLSGITNLSMVSSSSNSEVTQKTYLQKKSGKENVFIQIRNAGGLYTVIYIHGDFTLKSISNIPSIIN